MSNDKYEQIASVPEDETFIDFDEDSGLLCDDDPVIADPDTPDVVTGVVSDCRKLNVREGMFIGATILCELPVHTEVQVIVDDLRDEWCHVITASGVEGYCMRKYISIQD